MGDPAQAVIAESADSATSGTAGALTAGQIVAPGYGVLGHLHRSSVFDVYDVWSEERACRCVAKTLVPDRLADQDERDRLKREGQLLLRLSHPHIVRAYELVEQPEPVLILETLPGATLWSLIREQGRLRVADLVFLGLHLSSALHYLHVQGFLHLDLKPANIVCHAGLAKLIDLSIARRPSLGRGAGTPRYMAPEQVRCELLSEATDVWGIGVVLYEAAIGQPAFQHDDSRHEQLERRVDPVRSRRRLPSALANAIDRCLEPDLAGRPTVDQLLRLTAQLV